LKKLLAILVLFFLCISSVAKSCENWSKLEYRPSEVRDEFKDYNLGVNYIEADAILDTLADVLVTNFRHFYLSPFFLMGDWEENPENRWGLNYQVCFLTKSMDVNDDGKEEVLAYIHMPGERIDNHYLLQKGSTRWKEIMGTSGIIYIQETKTNNYYDIRLDNCCGYSPSVCKHDGSEYVCTEAN